MGNIGGEIATGAAGAIWHLILLIPPWTWALAFVAILGVVFVMRYATNWKVDLVGIILAVIIGEILVYRAHWIGMGYAEAQAQVKAAQLREQGYKNTEALIIACYANDTYKFEYVWDRTDGKCKRIDGGT